MKQIITNTITIFTLTLLSFSMQGQTVSDALRYSELDVVGSARSLGVGNSMNAIGADFTAFSFNPAGLGAYRSSEFVISPILYNNKTISSLNGGAKRADNISNLALGNIGFVIAGRQRPGRSLRTSNFAIGINRIADFNRQFRYSGVTEGSITDRYLEASTGVIPDNLNSFEEGLAYETGAIFDFDGDLNYDSDFVLDPGNDASQKSEVYTSSGSATELSLSYGGNLDDKLLFGVSANLPIVNFETSRSYEEQDIGDNIDLFNDLRFEEFLSTTGVGFNIKAGVIYNVDKMIRLGAAVHTPTWYSLADNYRTAMEYSYTDTIVQRFTSASPRGNFNFALSTPWQASGSLGLVFKKAGFISADVSWKDYSNSGFSYDVRGNGPRFREAERLVNSNIDQTLGSAITFRVGGEAAFKSLRFRAGLAMEQSPFTNDNSFNNSYHAGIGIRANKFILDIGYQLKTINDGYAPYVVGNEFVQPLVENDTDIGRLVMTVGARF